MSTVIISVIVGTSTGGVATAKGFDTGLFATAPNPMGSVSGNVINGKTLKSLLVGGGGSGNTGLYIELAGAALPQALWTSVAFTDSIGSPFSFTSAGMTFAANTPAGNTQWRNAVAIVLNPGAVIPFTFTFPVPTPSGKGDIMNPLAWETVSTGKLPPSEYDGIPGGGFV